MREFGNLLMDVDEIVAIHYVTEGYEVPRIEVWLKDSGRVTINQREPAFEPFKKWCAGKQTATGMWGDIFLDDEK